MTKYNILVVEDDEITALNLNLSLQKQGYNIIATCDNLTEAKSKIISYSPDIVIIDISLQESSDGIEIAKLISLLYF